MITSEIFSNQYSFTSKYQKIFLSYNAKAATTLHLFCQNIVCVSARRKKTNNDDTPAKKDGE
ncbi:MAG: hypothetical protein ACFNUH_09375 [Bacteroidota bacterium]